MFLGVGELKTTWLPSIISFVLLVVVPLRGAAYQIPSVEPVRVVDRSLEVGSLARVFGKVQQLEGEILWLGEKGLALLKDGKKQLLPLAEKTKVFINGRSASVAAVRPVAPDCGVLARVWLDSEGRIQLIDGYYQGAEVEVVYAKPTASGGYRLTVRGLSLEGAKEDVFETATHCKGLENIKENELIGPAYILFDFFGNIRGVYQR